MNFVDVNNEDGIVTLTLTRGKVNALNGSVINELRETFELLESDLAARAVILTGQGKFFSFGFDVPEFIAYTKEQFQDFVTDFTNLYRYLFTYPKPLVAAINGHAIAGGCMLTLPCDVRLMVNGNAKISLNEINFGSPVFAGSTEMLRFWVGGANATEILYSGSMYTADEAASLGLVNEVTDEIALAGRARARALELALKSPPAFSNIKALLRESAVREMVAREQDSIRKLVDIWYSDRTRALLRNITIK